jgi:hypothetical protein
MAKHVAPIVTGEASKRAEPVGESPEPLGDEHLAGVEAVTGHAGSRPNNNARRRCSYSPSKIGPLTVNTS